MDAINNAVDGTNQRMTPRRRYFVEGERNEVGRTTEVSFPSNVIDYLSVPCLDSFPFSIIYYSELDFMSFCYVKLS